MDKEKQIRQLTDKYLDGLTTTDEERLLREQLAGCGGDAPQGLAAMKALAAYVDSERQALAAPKAAKRGTRARLRLFIASAAAAAAVIFAVVTYALHQPGGYAVIDGQVYTDRQTVNEQALDALEIVASDCDESFDALELMQ